ncbi:chromate efflux transporter [Flavihumibacter cheonanensis]|uniref:chromate efflux transporter n=1 Tax=Flavihumibacter cheonanensis TaxID=1442385 RepID=UPI001EF783B2|nr:chromate efflux transporter [Flavihumibacter cheonanensis]MCG7752144.1 chromate efflux transporter [Flavihumibacter cheonanensis]
MEQQSTASPASNQRQRLTEVARVFLKLGIIGFGGPAVHIALMEEEVVRKRNWMTAQHFLDLVGATNLIPGPNSTEMTMHCGFERVGWKGLVVAGVCFIVPAVLITGLLAWAYQRYGQLPEVAPFIYGIKPAVLSVVLAVMISLGKKAVKNRQLALLGILALIAVLAGMHEVYVLFGAGAIGILLYYALTNRSLKGFLPIPLLQIVQEVPDLMNGKIFWMFLKIGSILYGSGYVLFAFLDAELVSKGWLSKQVLIDAIAVGQFTPGPVFSAATFIGWQLGGFGGAVAATVGIFLPSFLFVALLQRIVPYLRKSPVMAAFLDTVNVVSVAIILAVLIEMGQQTISDWRMIVIAVAGFLVSFFYPRVNSALIIVGGALLGYILTFVR